MKALGKKSTANKRYTAGPCKFRVIHISGFFLSRGDEHTDKYRPTDTMSPQ